MNKTASLSLSHSEVSIPGGVLLESETVCQLRQRWENLNKDQSTKLQLSLNSLEQDQLSPVHSLSTILTFFMAGLAVPWGFVCPVLFFLVITLVCRSSSGLVSPVPVWCLKERLLARLLCLQDLCLRPAVRLCKESLRR